MAITKLLKPSTTRLFPRTAATRIAVPSRFASSDTRSSTEQDATKKKEESKATQPQQKKKTQAELDEELKMKMAGLSGDGGESGVEYEDGQPASMKRSVRNNMFRYI
ncbi:uncharacterized protein K452DRAFT_243814 [Aplosporella prunicola CBS 121167]|uniref:Uncharacterized protein n=1 Tax=Aplosporella prunicola CBS 121167 TaxID=1176127 RepID=A0A6A6BN98_9PEZI|nr:uncharacterized protein K452DRAFT_243814 [Aplosporella prunicola CBS 121167]KAF2145619.1 hypothetical protein K452DRAFT_243814 [Aplosporella prunicola CBS 121167]